MMYNSIPFKATDLFLLYMHECFVCMYVQALHVSGASRGKKRTSGLEFLCYDLQSIMCDPLFHRHLIDL